MAEPEDMIMPMLREMRGEIRDGFARVEARFEDVDMRLERMEGQLRTFRQALTADTMMSKFITGDFEERIATLEEKVEALAKGR